MKILLDLMVDSQYSYGPRDLDVAEGATADDIIAALKASDDSKVSVALDLGLLEVCTLYVQVVDDDGSVTSRAEW